jgi:hypothetical protein
MPGFELSDNQRCDDRNLNVVENINLRCEDREELLQPYAPAEPPVVNVDELAKIHNG